MISKKSKLLILILFFAFFICAIFALMSGGYFLSIQKILTLIFDNTNQNISKMDKIVFFDIRLPRIFTAIIVGIALSVSGATYQACFQNPLVEPYILGASAGASFGAALGILYPEIFISISFTAFCFSLLAVFVAYLLANKNNFALILSGVIISSIFMAFVSILKYISDDSALREITFWMMGGFYYSSWQELPFLAFSVIASSFIIWLFSFQLNVLSLGDENARTLGVNPKIYKAFFILFATLISSICVANVGIIAWVGLMMPHAARIIVGPNNKFVILLSAMLGASYLLICDTFARTIIDGEIPIGVITSILGAPFLLILIKTKGMKLQ